MSHLQTENLTYIYGAGTPFKITALDNININIEKGDFVAIIGHTGSGKSTLVQHLNGLLKPTDGKIFLDGENIHQSKSKLFYKICAYIGLLGNYHSLLFLQHQSFIFLPPINLFPRV